MIKNKFKKSYDGKMSLKGYRNIIEKFLFNDYKFVSYEKLIIDKKHIIMRHDLDFLPEDAVEIAKIEKSYDIAGNYFFLVNTEFYNINSYKIKKIIDLLQKLGHNIGLHFDPKKTDTNWINDIKKEKSVLEKVIEDKIKIISFHRPLKKILDNNNKYGGVLHTYMPRYFSKIGYVSDSRGKWSFGTPFENKFYLENKAVQLLTHPEWWILNNSSRNKKLKRIFKKIQNNFDMQMKDNLSEVSIPKKKFLD